jgi:hypothetical protein
MSREGPCDSCGKKALNRHIMEVVYVQYVEINHLQAALCLTGYGASGEARQMHGRLYMSGTATLLKNGSVKPSGSSEGDRSNVKIGVEYVELRVV